MARLEDFMKLDIRVGEVISVEDFVKAKKPAYKLLIDFGNEIGIKKSSAQITACYSKEELIGKQILGAVNLEPLQIADYISEVLVLGIYSEDGVILIQPEKSVKIGDRLG